MSRVRDPRVKNELNGFEEYLRQNSALSAASQRNYVQAVAALLREMSAEDVRNQQMLIYCRGAMSTTYPALGAAWSKYVQFQHDAGETLALLPDRSRISFAHPVAPDAKRLLGTRSFYNGIPATLTWQQFMGMGLDQPTQMAALRLYQFFCNDAQPRADQPLIPRDADSMVPMPGYVVESIGRPTPVSAHNRAQLTYRHISNFLADRGVKPSLSTFLYRCFVAGAAKITRRADSSHDEVIEYLESRILAQDVGGFVKGVREWCDNPTDDQLLAVRFE